jgi:hypothetical protein
VGERDLDGVVMLSPSAEEGLPHPAEDRNGDADVPSSQDGLSILVAANRDMVVLILLALVAALAVASPTFRSATNIENVLDQDVIVAVVASGMRPGKLQSPPIAMPTPRIHVQREETAVGGI